MDGLSWLLSLLAFAGLGMLVVAVWAGLRGKEHESPYRQVWVAGSVVLTLSMVPLIWHRRRRAPAAKVRPEVYLVGEAATKSLQEQMVQKLSGVKYRNKLRKALSMVEHLYEDVEAKARWVASLSRGMPQKQREQFAQDVYSILRHTDQVPEPLQAKTQTFFHLAAR